MKLRIPLLLLPRCLEAEADYVSSPLLPACPAFFCLDRSRTSGAPLPSPPTHSLSAQPQPQLTCPLLGLVLLRTSLWGTRALVLWSQSWWQELVARTGFVLGRDRRLVRKRAVDRAQGGHRVFISENVPRCDMINSSCQLSDLLRGKKICTVVHSLNSPDTEDAQISPPNILHDLGSWGCKGL